VEQVEQQIPLRLLQEIGEPEFLPDSVVRRIETEADAVAWCWAMRRIKGLTMTEAARYLGVPKSHMSNILAGKKYPCWGFRIDLQRLCGNWLIRQWEDRHMGFRTVRETPEQRRIRELEARLEIAERKAA
jgi:transcriptional regulator with XRE-family HTH domain